MGRSDAEGPVTVREAMKTWKCKHRVEVNGTVVIGGDERINSW